MPTGATLCTGTVNLSTDNSSKINVLQFSLVKNKCSPFLLVKNFTTANLGNLFQPGDLFNTKDFLNELSLDELGVPPLCMSIFLVKSHRISTKTAFVLDMGNAHAVEKNVSFDFDDKKGIIRISESVANELRGKGIKVDKDIIFTSDDKQVTSNDLEKDYRNKLKRKDEQIDLLQRRMNEMGRTKSHRAGPMALKKSALPLESFEKVLNEFHSRYKHPDNQQICYDEQVNIVKCYNNHENSILNCSDAAKSFISCVSNMQKQNVEQIYSN